MGDVPSWVAELACLRGWCGWHAWVGDVLAWVTCWSGVHASMSSVGGVLACVA